MTNENNKIDWSDFNETEQQAIAIDGENMINGTDRPTFPYLAVVFEELAENLASIAMIKPNSALTMSNEIYAINKALLRIAPTPPVKDVDELMKLYTDAEIKQNLLACNVCFFLTQQLSNIASKIMNALEAVKEMEELGGSDATKH